MNEKPVYYLTEGTIQAYVAGPHYMHHFGRPEYDRARPIISERMRAQAQPIVDALNAGTMTEEQASAALDKIYW